MSSKCKPTSIKGLTDQAIHALDASRSRLGNTKTGLWQHINQRHAEQRRSDDLDNLVDQVVSLTGFLTNVHKLMAEMGAMCDASHRAAALPIHLSACRVFRARMDEVRPTLGHTTRGNEVLKGLADLVKEAGVHSEGVDITVEKWPVITKALDSIISELEGMKSETTDLELSLDRCHQAGAQLQNANKILRESEASLGTLKQTINLADAHQVAKVSHLTAILAAGPERREVLLQEQEAAEEALLDAAHAFVLTGLTPRVRDLEQRALASVEPKLKALYPEPDALRQAAYQSGPLRELAVLQEAATINVFNSAEAVDYAERLLETWKAADAFEKTHLS